MKQSLKFRQINNGQVHYWGYIENVGFMSPMASVEWHDTPSDQYTGLKDKNGKEVYENDIVSRVIDATQDGKYPNQVTICEPMVIKRSNMWDGYYFSSKKSYLGLFSPDIDDDVYRGIILGNIYENPELLEGDK